MAGYRYSLASNSWISVNHCVKKKKGKGEKGEKNNKNFPFPHFSLSPQFTIRP
jgi:hypothetical protein